MLMKISIGFSRVVTADPVLTCVRMTKRQGDIWKRLCLTEPKKSRS